MNTIETATMDQEAVRAGAVPAATDQSKKELDKDFETVGEVRVANPRMTTTAVDVYYGDKHAIKNVNLDIGANEVIAMIGPSGCGKSTYLRCLNRMNDTIDGCRVTGELKLDDQDIYDKRLDVVPLRARVGMVFQKPNPFPKSIYDNIAYGPRIHGLAANRTELDEIVETSLRKAGLWDEVKDRMDQPGTGLSGGQQQRLCIARTIAVAGSDPDGRALLRTRPDRHRQGGGVDRRTAAEFHHRHRHPLDAAGGARLAAHRLFPPG